MGTKPTYEELEEKVEELERLEAERRQAEEALLESERKYRKIAETTPDGMWICEEDGRISEVNDAACILSGYSRDELVGMYIHEIDEIESAEMATKRVSRLRQKGFDRFTSKHRCKDGSIIDVDVSISLLDKSESRGVAFIRDITERKQVEEALRESEGRYRAITESSTNLISLFDLEGNLLFTNPVGASMYGYEREEMTGMHFSSFITEERMRETEELFQRALAGEKVEGELLVKHKKGHEFPISFGLVQTKKGDKVVGFTAVSQDIADRKQAEEELRESEERFRLTAEETGQVVYSFDPETGQIKWAGAVEAVTGYTYEEFQSFDVDAWAEQIHPDDRETVLEAMDEAIGRRSRFDAEYRFRRKDGSYVVVEEHGAFVSESRSSRHPAIGTIADISDRKQAERERAELEAQFHQAQKLESVGRLAGGVAHDLNNLLSPILGYAEMLREEIVETDPGWEPLEEILDAGIRARDLVRQLLAFSRKQTMEFRHIDLNSLLSGFERLLRRTIREDIVIRMGLAETLPLVEGDVGQLEQVTMNLAVNAQDAMPDGGTLTLETALVELDESYKEPRERHMVKPGFYAMLVVSDTGSGMDKQTIEQVFEPFFTTKELGKGTGLGLATVYGIVKQHGGNVWVYSEPGLGTSFKIYLPVSMEASETIEPPAAKPSVLEGSETVLLVEDSVQVRRLCRTVLERRGYRVLAAEDGMEALQMQKHHDGPVHLLLTDVVMPDMNGKELFDRLSSDYPDLKVVYMSGYTDDVIVRHGVLEPEVHFMQKPFAVHALATRVREVLDE